MYPLTMQLFCTIGFLGFLFLIAVTGIAILGAIFTTPSPPPEQSTAVATRSEDTQQLVTQAAERAVARAAPTVQQMRVVAERVDGEIEHLATQYVQEQREKLRQYDAAPSSRERDSFEPSYSSPDYHYLRCYCSHCYDPAGIERFIHPYSYYSDLDCTDPDCWCHSSYPYR